MNRDSVSRADARVQKISAVLIARDAARTIDQCLQALEIFEEVVVCDTGSSDDTMERARSRNNVRLFEAGFSGFGSTKNAAAARAGNDWIFSIDADEVADAELLNALAAWDTNGDTYRLGIIDRRNFFMGKHVKRGGWGNDHIVRLFHRGTHRFSDVEVHESITEHPQSRKIFLAGGIDHSAAPDISSFLNKIRDYSELAAPTVRVQHPAFTVLRTIYTFKKSYFLQRGFLEGWRGLVIAWCAANGVFFKYMKAYARSRDAGSPR